MSIAERIAAVPWARAGRACARRTWTGNGTRRRPWDAYRRRRVPVDSPERHTAANPSPTAIGIVPAGSVPTGDAGGAYQRSGGTVLGARGSITYRGDMIWTPCSLNPS